MKEESNINDLAERLDIVESELIRQEHSVLRIVKNIFEYGFQPENGENFRSSWLALVNYILRRQVVTIIIALLSGAIALISCYLAFNANRLFLDQNRMINQQTHLLESERRSGVVFLFGNVLDRLDDELKDDYLGNEIRDISPQIKGRLVALSQRLRPYHVFENGELSKIELSPERGQLFSAIINSELDQKSLDDLLFRSNFTEMECSGNLFLKSNINRTNLSGSRFSKSFFENVNFENITLDNSIWGDVRYTDVNFRNSRIENSRIIGEFMGDAKLYNNDIRYSYVKLSEISDASLNRVLLEEGNYYGDTILIHTPYLSISNVSLYGTILSGKTEYFIINKLKLLCQNANEPKSILDVEYEDINFNYILCSIDMLDDLIAFLPPDGYEGIPLYEKVGEEDKLDLKLVVSNDYNSTISWANLVIYESQEYAKFTKELLAEMQASVPAEIYKILYSIYTLENQYVNNPKQLSYQDILLLLKDNVDYEELYWLIRKKYALIQFANLEINLHNEDYFQDAILLSEQLRAEQIRANEQLNESFKMLDELRKSFNDMPNHYDDKYDDQVYKRFVKIDSLFNDLIY